MIPIFDCLLKSEFINEQHSVPTETHVDVWVALSISDSHKAVEAERRDQEETDVDSVFNFFNKAKASRLVVTDEWDDGWIFWH